MPHPPKNCCEHTASEEKDPRLVARDDGMVAVLVVTLLVSASAVPSLYTAVVV